MFTYLEQHHLLAQSSTEEALLVESAKLVAATAATPGCPPMTVAHGPDEATSRQVIVRAVNLPAEVSKACHDAPDRDLRDLCEAMADGCVAAEGAIFCDRRWIVEVVALAAASRQAIAESVKFDQKQGEQFGHVTTIAPDMLLPKELAAELVEYWGALRAADQVDSVVPPRSISQALATGMATTRALARSFVSFGVGHEFAHVLQRACPGAHPISADVADRYVELTCAETSDKELAADLTGIDITRRVLNNLQPPPPPDPETFSEALNNLYNREHSTDVWISGHWSETVATTVIHYAEISAMQAILGEAASRIIRDEPAFGTTALTAAERAVFEANGRIPSGGTGGADMDALGAALARELAEASGEPPPTPEELEKRREKVRAVDTAADRRQLFSWYYETAARKSPARPKAYEHHLPLPYRLYLLQLELAGSDWDSRGDRFQTKERGLRFAGILRELIPAMQARCTRRSEQEKKRLSEEWIGGKLAGLQPSYFRCCFLACQSRDLLDKVILASESDLAWRAIQTQACRLDLADSRVNIHRRDERYEEFSPVGLPQYTMWTPRAAISRCPSPPLDNRMIDYSSINGRCDEIRSALRGAGTSEHLVEQLLARVTGARQEALSADVSRGDHCLLAEMRQPNDTAECVIELRGLSHSVSCAVNMNAFAECLKGHEGKERELCAKRPVCQTQR
jgi:hypothetical protein